MTEERKVYVGNLEEGTREEELEKVFKRYGGIESVWVARNPPGFAFVTFEDARDADDACRGEDGKDFNGRRSGKGKGKGKGFSNWYRGGKGDYGGGYGGYDGGYGGRDSGGYGGRDSGGYGGRDRSRSDSRDRRRQRTRSRSGSRDRR
ncbi:arginine/serine-rich splicing factor, putative [Perkinsus marinus ATCC 50983]|uniref:Arginine/serine-rich splicing factor, putative n=1 Tax=Perkinsus marinus (strain ATCC 50983 / TXsc) TaxID=423536 RepID=C5LAM1_PERM5|nr:arginine/serine-rich splicing factor, putative [Perkinsus marinus ATCC 50983]EER06477.1 arginine/serine-rich splicing factor, putative [Perkinsus marinus ATCC 50983]|eukprot:XP_002774661.1 arginine/serine-rich splicing factor, putative [Perkinsus marinus ATCC 50983]